MFGIIDMLTYGLVVSFKSVWVMFDKKDNFIRFCECNFEFFILNYLLSILSLLS